MSLSDDILTILFGGYRAGYKAMWRTILGNTRPTKPRKQIKQATLYLTIARLKKNGLIAKQGSVFKITTKGKKYYHNKITSSLPCHTKSLDSKQKEAAKKNMIIAFDIPERHRRKRAWLRLELTFLGFTPIQKSVWFGPAPLPRNFVVNLNDLGILQYLKFFKAEEKEIV